MSIFHVSTTSQLVSAVTNAKAGDSILLASGTYSSINFKHINPAGNVLITSADIQHPAVFTDLMLRYSSNLTISNVSLQAAGGAVIAPFQVSDSSNIGLDHLMVGGPVLGSAARVTGLTIRGSNGVSVTNSEFSNLRNGIGMLDNTHVTITHNSFHDLVDDGVRGGGDSNILVSNNLFRDFHPAVGDHPDGIQFWTTNTTTTAHDIAITGNVVIRGSGDMIQGIFLRDTFETLPFANVTISNNFVAGAMYNGITVDGVIGANISNNVNIGFADQRSWIRVQHASNLVLSGNASTFYLLPIEGVPAGNKLISSATDGGASVLQSWLTANQLTANLSPTASVTPLQTASFTKVAVSTTTAPTALAENYAAANLATASVGSSQTQISVTASRSASIFLSSVTPTSTITGSAVSGSLLIADPPSTTTASKVQNLASSLAAFAANHSHMIGDSLFAGTMSRPQMQLAVAR